MTFHSAIIIVLVLVVVYFAFCAGTIAESFTENRALVKEYFRDLDRLQKSENVKVTMLELNKPGVIKDVTPDENCRISVSEHDVSIFSDWGEKRYTPSRWRPLYNDAGIYSKTFAGFISINKTKRGYTMNVYNSEYITVVLVYIDDLS